MPALKIDDLYRGRTPHPWLRAFESSRVRALNDLLTGRAILGHLQPGEPDEILRNWMRHLGGTLPEAIDEALSNWIRKNWGKPLLPETRSARVTAVAWNRACDLVGSEEALVRAHQALHRHFLQDREFLSAMRSGRAGDPEGRAWLALARRQDGSRDEELIAHWWRLCELPVDAPWYHGHYGILGLENIPEEARGTGGGFPNEAADGLIKFRDALLERVEECWIREEVAKREFQRVARLSMWSFHLTDKWVSFWRQTLPPEGEPDREHDRWVRELIPDRLSQAHRTRDDHPRRSLSTTYQEVQAANQRLYEADAEAVAEARRILRDRREYADATGDRHYIVRTASSFAARIGKSRPEIALEWARLARRYKEDHEHAWAIEASLLADLGRFAQARRVAFEAVKRFPYDAFAHTTLAEVLRAQGELEEAETVYRETVRCFPENPVAWTGLGDLLCLFERFEEAHSAYGEAFALDAQDRVAQAGLRRAKQGMETRSSASPSVPSAESRERSKREPSKKDRSKRAGAKALHADDLEKIVQDAWLLRRWGQDRDPAQRRAQARELLGHLTLAADESPAAAGEGGLIALDLEEIEQALDLLRRAVTRFPGSARVSYALARAEQAAGHLAEQRAAFQKLARIDSRFEAVRLLDEARLSARQEDKPEVLRDLCGELAWRTAKILDHQESRSESGSEDSEVPPFQALWSQELRRNLFDGKLVTRAEDIVDLETVRRNLLQRTRALRRQEENWVEHYAAA